MIVTDLFESTAGSSEDTAKQVYQHMIRKIPEFMYTAPTADVKKAISKAMSFGPQISVPDLATYAYGILKTKDLDEAYAINEGDVSTSNLRTMYDLARMAKNYCNPEGQESLNELLRILKWYMDQHDSDAINEGEVSTSNLRTMYDLASMAKNYCNPEGHESLNELLKILKWYMDQAEQGVTESSEDNPVANAITRRILMQRTDLLAKYGPVKVMNAIDDVADFVGDVEEIGSSDVSGWIRQIEQSLQSMNTELTEFAPSSDDGNDGFSDETLKRLAAQWWNGDEDPRVEQTLMAAGWEIGQDDGYDDGGVFVVQAGDNNGNSYISWPATELESLAEGGNVFMPDIQNTPEYKAGFETGKLPVPYPEGTQQYASYYKGVIDKATPNLNKGVAEGWRDLFRSKSAPAASGATGSRSLSPTFSANIPNPATNKPYTNAELRALAGQTANATVAPTTARTGGKVPGQISMTPNAIRKREARKSVTTTAAAAPNPFGQMANQLQNYKTSTGGQVRGTATGLKHTASPDNPNAMPAAAPAAPAATAAPVVKRSVKSSVRPNFAPQNAGYKSVNYAPNVKTGAAMPKPFGVPTARSATRVTSGGPTADEKAKLARRIAQAVKEPVAEMLKMVETKEDVQRIKKFIDDTFVKYGAVNESTFALRNQILEHVTQVGARRRRDFAAQRTH